MNKFRAGGIVVAAAALVALTNSPAMAGTNATSWGQSMKDVCSASSVGTFEAEGEWFHIKDVCADNMSAVLKVDVAPFKPNGGYDFTIWNPGKSGSTKSVNKKYDEGTGVCIQAGLGEYNSGEWGLWGEWSCGVA
ncbi:MULTISPECIES: hypothetical protein [unclassified Streptomyces]|uniref:hypothetical protein n=1 Tax=unclassified Streptomyces TaxID=2593676 RepID=UPI0029A4CDD8|nr:hypothetical protein [Streptomyces sp. FL07-04A]MDX3579817.1 hypothetical protein [Streptomyces sp. FL07-04A]